MQTYFTWARNRKRPFKVEIETENNNEIVNVYELIGKEKYSEEPLVTFKPRKIFIGKSEKSEKTSMKNTYGPKYDGNTILLQLNLDNYAFIGQTMYIFKALAEIIKYDSPVIGKTIPYSWAIDKKQNVYLFADAWIVKKNKEMIDYLKDENNDPYGLIYGESDEESRPDLKESLFMKVISNGNEKDFDKSVIDLSDSYDENKSLKNQKVKISQRNIKFSVD